MLVDVIRLREKGMRLKGRELQPASSGHLVVRMESGYGMSHARSTMVAHLGRKHTNMPEAVLSVLPSIHDVALILMEDGRFTLQGVELEIRDGRAFEHMQFWRCRPILELHNMLPQSGALSGGISKGPNPADDRSTKTPTGESNGPVDDRSDRPREKARTDTR